MLETLGRLWATAAGATGAAGTEARNAATQSATAVQFPTTASVSTDSEALATSAVPFLVPLRRRLARSLNEQGGKAAVGANARHFYVGMLTVGQPAQKFRVAFDTASGQLVLPTARCGSMACREHRRYSPRLSATAADINADGTPVRLLDASAVRDAISIGISSMDLGDGEITGDLVREVVCLGSTGSVGGQTCAELGVVAATDMTDVPFRGLPHDGVVGLGLQSLSIGPIFSALTHLRGGPSPANFGFYLGSQMGELAIGSPNLQRLAGPLLWSPVVRPEEGYWQVKLMTVRMGNRTLQACDDGKCRGIVDTCASRIGVPTALLPEVEEALSAQGFGSRAGGCSGPELALELEGGVMLTLRPEDYRERGPDGRCGQPLLSPLDLPEGFAGAFILGEPLLRRYYAAFDASAEPRLGLGLAAPVDPAEEAAKAGQADAEEAALPSIPEELFEEESLQKGLMPFILQAMVMQVALILILFCTGLQLRTAAAGNHSLRLPPFVMRFGGTLSSVGLLPESSRIIWRLPATEIPPQADDCVICLGCCESEDPKHWSTKAGRPHWCRLRCGHQFHEQCILEWLWKAQRCPVCRAHMLESHNSGGVDGCT